MARILVPQWGGSLVVRALLLPFLAPWGRRLLLLLSPVLASGLVFWLSSAARSWILGHLGYGSAPVAFWLLLFLICLLYKWRWLFRYWRWWQASALLVAASLGGLSLYRGPEGLVEESTLGGTWGQVLGGFPIFLGGLKVAGLLSLVPVTLVPRRTWRAIKRGLVVLASGILSVLSRLGALISLSVEGVSNAVTRGFRRSPISERSTGGSDSWEEPDLSSYQIDESQDDVADVESPFPLVAAGPTPARRRRARHETRDGIQWPLPFFDLIDKGEVREMPESSIQEMAERIKSVLGEHGVEVEVGSVRVGPRIIRFGLAPGWVRRHREGRSGRFEETESNEMGRVKVQSILAREKDLALALKTHSIRMEAPVPGEAVVGLEVPNPQPSSVYLRSLVESSAFQGIMAKDGLPVALGEDVGGAAVVADLKELPHLLIAGATGSGKSVCLNTIIGSLLLVKRPDQLRLVLIDPKRVELTPYNGIPHLAIPVVVDTDQVVKVLDGMMREMFQRYMLMEDEGVRNIEGYNAKADQALPHYVLIIDELADLLMAAGEVEQSLVRLGQLGRATGIHLVLATQRPSVNVVTGLLKANIPCRIAFAVASQVDSRVILDSAGAEKLLGKGDMLLLTQESPKPRRVQGTYVSEEEIQKVVRYWHSRAGPPVEPLILEREDQVGESGDGEEDELLEAARELAGSYNHISPSTFQRRLQIGYTRALQLIQLLEDEGLVAPGEIGKSRQTLVKRGR